jgi:TetR/AcrR family transcriptional regulator, tetracycline repressor protein
VASNALISTYPLDNDLHKLDKDCHFVQRDSTLSFWLSLVGDFGCASCERMKQSKPQTVGMRPKIKPKAASSDSAPVKRALTPQQIVDAALALIDERGLAAFNMRDVAGRLGVYHRAIYWHFPDGRNAVLAAVAAVAFDDVLPTEVPTRDWKRWLGALFRNYRDSLCRHPNVAPLIGAQIVSNAGVDPRMVEKVLEALTAGGFSGEDLIGAYNATIAAMLGYVTLELAPAPAEDPEWSAQFEAKLRQLRSEDYPLLAAHRETMLNRSFILRWRSGAEAPLSNGFDTYVEAFIAGLESRRSRG